MKIQHNILSMNAYRNYANNTSVVGKHLEALSSGYRINRAADDAAGLAISEKMRAQITGLNQGINNAKDGLSLCRTADGALMEVHDMLNRLKKLSTEAANGTYSETERQEIQKEVDQILSEIDRISEASTFNGQTLFSGGVTTVSAFGSARLSSEISRAIQAYHAAQEAVESGAIQKMYGVMPLAEGGTVCGDFTVTGGVLGTDYTFEDGVLTVISSTSITIRNTDPAAAAASRIEVAGGVSANITLENVNIDMSNTGSPNYNASPREKGYAALKIADGSTGDVAITLKGDNTLKGGFYCAALEKNGGTSSGALTIQGPGTLTAEGGYDAAGIGGGGRDNNSVVTDGCNITIKGCSVAATGYGGGTGIGGGAYGNGRNITITDASVKAVGGKDHSATGGAGIGGGFSGSASNITITGSVVDVTAGNNSAGIGGGYNNGSSVNPVIQDSMVRNGDTTIFSGTVILKNDLTIDKGTTLKIENGNALIIAEGVTLTNNGTINILDGKIDNKGTIVNNGAIRTDWEHGELTGIGTIRNNGTIATICGAFDVIGGALRKDTAARDFEFDAAAGLLRILSETEITIIQNTTAATNNRIEVEKDVSANVTLAGVNIDVSGTSGAAAFKIEDDSTGSVTVTLADGTNNILRSGSGCAGLEKNGFDGALIIAGSTGKLNVTGGADAAGIGGGNGCSGGNITITGGVVTAYGGENGAGIGSGNNGGESNITITGGTVTATGGNNAAGIGGGQGGFGRVSNITIENASVKAFGGSNGAGIGGGSNGSGCYVQITNSIVRAKKGADAEHDIGHGQGGSGNIIINGSGLIIFGDEGFLTEDLTVWNDFTIDDDVTVEIRNGAALTVGEGVTLTNEGTVENHGAIDIDGTLVNNGTINNYSDGRIDNDGLLENNNYIKNDGEIINNGIIRNSGRIDGLERVTGNGTVATVCGDFEVIGGTLKTATEDGDFEFVAGVLKILTDANLIIQNTDSTEATTDRIVVADGVNANITLAGVNIRTNSGAAFEIEDNSAGNVTVTLADGTENILQSGAKCAGLQKNGDASSGTLTIKGEGALTATAGTDGAGIGGADERSGSNITIAGGAVTAIGGTYGSGIGGGDERSGSNIAITGGTVTATGGSGAAGIGGGWGSSGNDITISGGTVTAAGGNNAAGIGGGTSGSGSDITISGGTVTAAGGEYGSGIGGGYRGDGNNIEISGGDVTAKGGRNGAGIGGGSGYFGDHFDYYQPSDMSNYGHGNGITISGGTVTADGGEGAAGIGGGYYGDGRDIEISGGTVTAAGGTNGAGIGGGSNYSVEDLMNFLREIRYGHGFYDDLENFEIELKNHGIGSDIRISGGTVMAAGGTNAAGIGGGYYSDGSDIKISGGTVTATGGTNGAGIGGGSDYSEEDLERIDLILQESIDDVKRQIEYYEQNGLSSDRYFLRYLRVLEYLENFEAQGYGNGRDIEISGGDVTANGGDYGAGIGGGYRGDGSNITIGDSIVRAFGGKYGAGIGGGYHGYGRDIAVNNSIVRATGWSERYHIGRGYFEDDNEYTEDDDAGIDLIYELYRIYVEHSLIIYGNKGTLAENFVIDKDFTLDDDVTLEIKKGAALTVKKGAAFTNEGTIDVYGKTVNNESIVNNGTINIYVDGELVNNGTLTNNGTINNLGTFDNRNGTFINNGTLTGNAPIERDDPKPRPDPPRPNPSRPDDPSGGGSETLAVKRFWIQFSSDSGDGIYIEIESINTEILGLRDVDITTADGAGNAISVIEGAINKVSSARGTIGAQQNRLEHTISNEMNMVENMTDAESLIRDTDVAEEMMGLIKANILAQAGMSMLAHANSSNEGVLNLLQ